VIVCRNTFLTELFPDDITTNLANNALLAVDLGDLTIRSDISDRTFERLLGKFILSNRLSLIFLVDLVELEQNTPRLPMIDDDNVRITYLFSHYFI